MGRRRWRPLALVASIVVLAAIFVCAAWTWSSFSSTTVNPANSVVAGTVALTDNDSGTAVFSMSGVKPGDTDTGCIQVTSTGTLPSLVKLYGATSGTGLDAYLTLTVTRGTVSSGSFDDCTNFSADATNYAGLGAGVLYSGLLNAFPTSYAAGVADPRTASVPEVWTTSEVHAYKLTLTVADVNAAQGLNMTEVFTWEARNTTLYSQVILSDQPAGYWKLDETAGTTATDATGSVNGTYSSVTLNQTTGVKDAGTAVTFADVNADKITMGDNFDYAGTATMSVEFWIKPTAANGYFRRIVSKEAAGGWNLYLIPSAPYNRVEFARGDAGGTADFATTPSGLTTGAWAYVVVTYDGSNMRVYVDGTLRATTASSRSVQNDSNPMTVGEAADGSDAGMGGSLDELAIYGYALSAQQITEHYNTGLR